MENEVLTSAVCPTCGAPLKVIDENGTMQCEYCGVTSLDNRHTFTHVSRDFASELEYQLTNAEALLDSEYYDKAFSAYYNLMENHSADWRVWWGLLRSRTRNFLLVDIGDDLFKTAEHYYGTAMKHLSDDKKKKECEAAYEKWKGLVFAYNKAIADSYRRFRLGRKIIGFVFFAAFIAFLLFYYIVVNQYFFPATSDLEPTALGFVFLSPAIFSFVLGIAAVICKVGYVNVYMNLTSLGCGIMFTLADPEIAETVFKSFEETVMFAIYVFSGFLMFQIITILARIPAKIARNRS